VPAATVGEVAAAAAVAMFKIQPVGKEAVAVMVAVVPEFLEITQVSRLLVAVALGLLEAVEVLDVAEVGVVPVEAVVTAATSMVQVTPTAWDMMLQVLWIAEEKISERHQKQVRRSKKRMNLL